MHATCPLISCEKNVKEKIFSLFHYPVTLKIIKLFNFNVSYGVQQKYASDKIIT
jgi:hypothetical protein